MKIAISAGHNVYINGLFDPGAVRQPNTEADFTKETLKYLIPMFISEGIETLDVTPYNQRFSSSREHHVLRANKVNAFNPDLYLDIHMNAGGSLNGHSTKGTGVECWVHNSNSASMPFANRICERISGDIGLKNRGVKFNNGFWSLSLTKVPSIIVEGAFIDDVYDMSLITPERYAKAIVEAVLNKKVSTATDSGLKDIKLKINDVESTVKGFKIDGTNYTAIRVLEQFGYKLDWDSANETVLITNN